MQGIYLANANWEQILVSDPSFVAARPTTCFVLDNSILIFGGESRAQFVLKQTDIEKNKAKITQSKATFRERTGFGQGSDAVIKIFNNKILAVDAHLAQYHVYDDSQQVWLTKAIR